MTTLPQPSAPTSSYTATYDAWNRLVKLVDGANTVTEYAYDGARRGWCVPKLLRKLHFRANGSDASRSGWSLETARSYRRAMKWQSSGKESCDVEPRA